MEHIHLLADLNKSHESSSDNDTDHNDQAMDPAMYCSLLGVLTAIGLVGNCLILVLFSNERYCRTSYSVYARALAVSDSFVLGTTLADDAISRLLNFTILHRNPDICFLWLNLTFFFMVLSSALVLAIAVDRYIAVCKPMQREKMCTFKRAIWTTAFLIVVCFVLAISGTIWNETEAKKLLSSQDFAMKDFRCPILRGLAFRLYEIITGFVFILFAPFCLVMILNLRSTAVIRAFLKSQIKLTGERIDFMVQVRVTLSFIAVTIASVLMLLPIIIVELIEMVIQLRGTDHPSIQDTIDVAWSICNAIRLINYAQNFYVFIIFGKEYRTRIVKLLGLSRNININPPKSYQSNMDTGVLTEASQL